MRILITGSNGFIGKHLSQSLNNEHELIGISRSQGHDLTETALDEVAPVDTVIHLASNSFVPNAYVNPKTFYKDNYLSTLNVLEYCKDKGIKKLIFISSYVYGKPDYLPVDEAHQTNISNPYGRSKLICEHLCRFYSADFNLNVTILRPFNIFGYGQNDMFLIPTILKQVTNKEVQAITLKDLRPKRDFLYIKDFVNLLNKIILVEDISNFSIFNVGYGQSYSVREVAEEACKVFGFTKAIVDEGEERPNEIIDCYADISKIKQFTGWSPMFDLNKGLFDLKGFMK